MDENIIILFSLWRMIILLFLLGEESGSQQPTSTFSKKFVEKVRNVISYYYSLEN
jgi:hypothetical protein